VQRCIDAIEMFLPVGRENAKLSHELRQMVIGAVSCSVRTYDTAHSRVTFGKSWRVRLPNGTDAMMIWRPDPEQDHES
jgi:hypothetical protein